MSNTNELDLNTLNWVKSEIDETMKQARTALEAYVEDQKDESQILFCINYLHQVYGTLQMVELYGASLLSEELEKLAQAIHGGQVKNREEAFEVMIRGSIQLPDYLEKLQAGYNDTPMVLLPLLNDFRTVRSAALLSETALFNPNLDVDVPMLKVDSGEHNISELAKNLRHKYHIGLLGWFKNKNINKSFTMLMDVLKLLRGASDERNTSLMLMIAEGVVESLNQDGLESSIAVKSLMGKVDRKIKEIIDGGEVALAIEPPTDLFKNLLYYVACSSSSGERTSEVKELFDLASVMPDVKTLEKARADLTAPNVELMETVSAVMMDDLRQVKDTLDVYIRSESRDASQIQIVSEKLDSMADTLGMLGLGPERSKLLKHVELVNGLADGSHEFDENELMGMASDLIGIENALINMGQLMPQVAEEQAAKRRHVARTPEQRKLMDSVIDEAKIDLAKVKNAITEFSRQLNHPEVLEPVPELLDKVRGSLSILSLDRAANLMQKCKAFVENYLIPTNTIPEFDTLNYLADAISSIEYYMESLVDSWGEPSAILNVAETSLYHLGDLKPEKPAVRNAAEGRDAVSQALAVDEDTLNNLRQPPATDIDENTIIDLAQPEGAENTLQDIKQIDDMQQELDTPVNLERFDSQIEVEPTLTIEIDSSSLEEPDKLNHTEDKKTEPEEFAIDHQDIEDNEPSLDLDFQVAGEIPVAPQIERLDEALGLWFGDSGSDDVTSLIQEIISTVAEDQGARNGKITNICKDMQDIIKRVTEGSEDFSDEIKTTLLNARDAINNEFVTNQDIPEISTSIEAEATVQPENHLVTSLVETTHDSAAEATRLEEIDDEIFEIFLEEAEEEHENISRLLSMWKSNLEDVSSLKDMRRSFHTLKGSGRLVGASDLGEFAWAFENMLNQVIDGTITVTPELLDLLERGKKTLPKLYEMLKVGDRPGQHIFSLMEHADALSRGESFTPLTETIISQELQQPEEFLSNDHLKIPKGEPAKPPLDVDPVLLEIYRKEVATHIASIRQFIELWRVTQSGTVSDTLFRAIHTLNGSARTTGVESVSELCTECEKYLKCLQNTDQPITEKGVVILQDITRYIEKTCAQLDQPGAVIAPVEELVMRIDAVLDELQFDTPTVELSISKEDFQHLDIQGEPSVTISGPDDEYDEELLEIFIEEGTEILEESDRTLQKIFDNPEDKEHIEALQRQLHTLKGGARMSGVTQIGDLSHRVESLLLAVSERGLQNSDDILKIFQHAQDKLVSMLEQLKNQQKLSSARDIMLEIDKLLGLGTLQGNEIEVTDAGLSEVEDEIELTSSDIIEIEDEDPIQLLDITEAYELDVSNEIEPAPVLTSESEIVETNVAETVEPESGLGIVGSDTGISQDLSELPEAHLPEPAAETKPKRETGEQIRIRAAVLDNLVNFAGEVSIYRSRLEQQVNTFRFNLQELDETVERFRNQLRKFEIEAEAQIQHRKEETLTSTHVDFDPLEFDRFTQMQQLSRSMMESMNDIDSLRSILAGLNRESETLLLQQSRINTELQEGLMGTRMIPFKKQEARLKRIVRQTCKELGKQAELELNGIDLELDRTVVDRILPAIEHMLRNAVAHGIETPAIRKQAGKAESGTIQFNMDREGSDVVIQISDDGAGINLEAIEKKAVEKGIIKTDADVSKKFLMDLILESGFSTAEEITQVAGRGVGMDVVNNEIKQLGGLLNIETMPGQGARFTVSMPLTLAVTRALLVQVGEETYAVPLLSVEGVERVLYENLIELHENLVYEWVGEKFHYLHLGHVMGTSSPVAPVPGQKGALLMVHSGEFRAAIEIEGLLGSREIVVKPVGPQLSTLRGISGATIMGDGSVVLILDLGVLIRLALSRDEHAIEEQTEEEASSDQFVIGPVEDKAPVVMVVDDSITVRKVTTRFLERNDMKIMQAKDGVDALQQLLEHRPDVMLLDVEMPRMDGFELATNMRNDEQLRDIPIIMITSRTGQKHRDRALNIGVNVYMGKPYNEIELLENIQSLLAVEN